MSLDVSVVVPTFRRPVELREALDSALSQQGVTIEILVVDDCPDGSAAPVVEALGDARVRYMRNPVPTGGWPSIVRNLGWPQATGRIVHFLDDDDIVPPDHYRTALAAFDANPGIGVVFGRIEPFGDPTQLDHERAYFARAARRATAARRFGPKWGFAGYMFFAETLLVCSAGMVRRECVAEIGGFDPHIKVVEDVDFYARAIRRFGAHSLERTVLQYRIGPSLMHRPDIAEPVRDSYRRMHAKYRASWGRLDFWALKLFARTVLKLA